MLSRIADSLFWITRYLERAEDTARILDVNYYMMLEGAQRADRLRWAPLVSIAGAHDEFFALYPEADPRSVLEFLGFSAEHPDSIMECVGKARENARTIRDRISREMWEDINGLYLEVGRFTVDDLLAAGPHRFCELVKSGSHRFMGVSRATFPRDEGWHFLNAGQALERAEMTARIVDVQYHTLVAGPTTTVGDPDTHQWMAVLKSVAAYEFYRRTYNTRIEPTRVAELLLLHPQHPRSLRFSVGILQSALRAISQSGVDTYANEAERLTGRLYDSLKYDRIEDILGRGLHPFLTDVQRTCRAIGEELARTYFYYEVGA